jgi:crotonobetainyl-CoA:carnitine CoA-transferase CaiB-like acyl-CoA transferase
MGRLVIGRRSRASARRAKLGALLVDSPIRSAGTTSRPCGVRAFVARHAARGGPGAIVDVSTYEAMVIAMGGLPAMSVSVLGVDSHMYQRSLELPSIVPTADGMVGFCTITARQFQDFLVMIDRADLVDDAELASFAGRVERRFVRGDLQHCAAA